MNGAAIDAINECVPGMVRILADEPRVRESALLSIIAFNDSARVLVPLGPIVSESVADLSLNATGTTLYSKALRSTKIVLETGRTNHPDQNWSRPIVFFMTDGNPTKDDPWPDAVKELRSLSMAPHIYPIGFGDARIATLEQIRTDESFDVSAGAGDIANTMRTVIDGVTRTIHYMSTYKVASVGEISTQFFPYNASDEIDDFTSDTDFHA